MVLLLCRFGVFSSATSSGKSLPPQLAPGTNTAEETKSTCAPSEGSSFQTLPKVHSQEPVLTLHSLTVWSREAVSTKAKSGESTAEFTQKSWPLKVCLQMHNPTLQSFADQSEEQVRTWLSFEEKTAERT